MEHLYILQQGLPVFALLLGVVLALGVINIGLGWYELYREKKLNSSIDEEFWWYYDRLLEAGKTKRKTVHFQVKRTIQVFGLATLAYVTGYLCYGALPDSWVVLVPVAAIITALCAAFVVRQAKVTVPLVITRPRTLRHTASLKLKH